MHPHVGHGTSHSWHVHVHSGRVDVSRTLAICSLAPTHSCVAFVDLEVSTAVVKVPAGCGDTTSCIGRPNWGGILEGCVVLHWSIRLTSSNVQPDGRHFVERARKPWNIFVRLGDDGGLVGHCLVHELD